MWRRYSGLRVDMVDVARQGKRVYRCAVTGAGWAFKCCESVSGAGSSGEMRVRLDEECHGILCQSAHDLVSRGMPRVRDSRVV